MKNPSSLARRLIVGASALLIIPLLTAQQEAPTPGAGERPAQTRARDREPSWLMDKVEGPNLHYRTFDSKTVGAPVSYLIYLPPGYEKDKAHRYPVVYWLHGIGGSQQGVPGMAANMNEAIAAGKMPPVIFVFCNGMIRGGWSDSQWPVETVTIKELIPYIDATYRTIPTREGRGVEGFSMGGGGAATWGFKYPELFGAVSILAGARMGGPGDAGPARRAQGEGGSPAAKAREAGAKGAPGAARREGAPTRGLSRESPWELVKRNLESIRGRQVVRIAVGDKDNLKKSNTSLHEFLTGLGVAHEFDIIPNAAHSPAPVYAGLGDRNWAFYQKAFGNLK